MQKKFYNVFLVLLGALCLLPFLGVQASAAPSRSVEQTLTQPSGETFKAVQQGDEGLNWVVSETGEILKKGEDNYWHYAEIKSEKLEASTQRYKIDKKPQSAIKPDGLKGVKRNEDIKPGLDNSKSSGIKKTSSFKSSSVTSSTSENVLLLLVQFNDVSIKYSDAAWSKLFFATQGSSVNSYYDEVSGGNFKFTPARETSGTSNDGVIKVTLNYDHPNTAGNTGTDNIEIFKNALKATDKYIDYASYDSNGNGEIEANELHFVIIVAGYETSYSSSKSPSVWGHMLKDSSMELSLDNIKVGSSYVQVGEVHGDYYYGDHMSTIGIICHEIGHDLGLPDLYDTDYSSKGIGIYSLMAGGSWNYDNGEEPGESPANLDPWCKIKLGFITPTTVSASGKYTVDSIGTGDYNVLKIPTSDSEQYFLVENRQFQGFDSGLDYYCKSGGVAIWHIDESVINSKYEENSINDDEDHKGIDLEESNEQKLGYRQLDIDDRSQTYDNFYYKSNNTAFSPGSFPNSNLYDGTSTNATINSTGGSSSSMSVDIAVSNTAEQINVSSIKLNKNTLQIVRSRKETLTTSIEPSNSTNQKIIWSTSDRTVATVDSNGVVKGNKIGIATITATTDDKVNGVPFTDSCTVYVTGSGGYVKVTNITLNKESMVLSYYKDKSKGQKSKLTATITPSNATFKSVKWSSSDETVATVDANGNVTAKGAGEAVIKATSLDGEVIGECKVSVTDKPVQSITLDKTSLSLLATQKAILVASINPSNADYKDVIWSSSNTKVATVDSAGNVTTISKGSATITALSANEGKKATCKVTVTIGIELSKTSVNTKVGQSQVIKAKVDKILSSEKVAWISSDDSVVTVTDSGQIKALKAGTAVVTARIIVKEGEEESIYESTCKIIVKK